MRRVTLGIGALLLAMAPIASAQQGGSQPQGGVQPAAAAAIPSTFNIKVIATAAFPAIIQELRAKFEQLNAEFKPRIDQINGIQSEIQKIQTEIETKGQTLNQQAVANLKSNYDRLQLDLKQQQERAQAEYDQRLSEVVGPVYQKINQFLESYASQRGISMILDASNQETRIMAYVSSDADVTQDFINEYNRVNPVAGGASTTQPRPTNPAPANPANRPRTGGRP